jgi:hypothetical protein
MPQRVIRRTVVQAIQILAALFLTALVLNLELLPIRLAY